MFMEVVLLILGFVYLAASWYPVFNGGNMDMSFFGPAMAFVALSRVESLERKLKNKK